MISPFYKLFEFESKIAAFFGAPYGVAVDCCTHGLELCLILSKQNNEKSLEITCPKKTYISVPFMLEKTNFKYKWSDDFWSEYYYLTSDIIDAATLWKENSFITNTKMCLSFHFKKHLNIGRGGMILLDNFNDYKKLLKMRYDGRLIYENVLYENDTIEEIGYHYYMTPETAEIGLNIFNNKKHILPKIITSEDYSDVTQFGYFKNKKTSL